jgi:hypothetical protein
LLRCSYMSSDWIIVDALKLAHNLLGQNLRSTTEATTVLRLRELVDAPFLRSALERGSDSLPVFALRETAMVP